MNPLALLDSLLEDYASPKTRRAIHTVILIIVGLVTIWLGVEGNWKEFAAALFALVYASANRANTAPPADPEPGPDGYTGDTSDERDWGLH